VNGTIKFGLPLAAALAIAACSSGGSTLPGTTGTNQIGQSVWPNHYVPQWYSKHLARQWCPQVMNVPTCLVLKGDSIDPNVNGLAPSDFQTRYKLPSTKGSGQVVALVDAYDQPNAASDLQTYRTQWGLGKGKFNKYNQSGQKKNYPESCSVSSGWCVEEDLDIEMVAAVCPKCTIDLIETEPNSLPTGDVEAVKLGAHIVSNSWICYGSNNCAPTSDFNAKGVVYLAATGDRGYNLNGAPESLSTVVAVGGTTLTKSGSKYTEVVWPDAGGGCSDNGGGSGVAKPSWQKDKSCKFRTDGDVAAVACVCVAEYDSLNGGWFLVGGTSVASPMNAGIFALAGNANSQNAGQNFWALTGKARKQDLHYISSGSDGTCGGSYLCTAGTKQFGEYAGPIGWGTPNGIKAY
jgi:hypothetical protein